MTMNEITRSLDYWLRQNGLSTEGATLTITLSSKDDAYRAVMGLQREMEPLAFNGPIPALAPGDRMKMNGLGLKLDAPL